jgi:hypothetical protein
MEMRQYNRDSRPLIELDLIHSAPRGDSLHFCAKDVSAPSCSAGYLYKHYFLW